MIYEFFIILMSITIFSSLIISYFNNPHKKYKIYLNIFNWTFIILSNFLFFKNDYVDYNYFQLFYLLLFHLFFWNIFIEIYFYITHRIFHEISFLYKYIHKLHHNGISDCILDAQWVHPIETLLITIPTYLLWPFICNLFNILIPYQILLIMATITTFDNINNHITNCFHMDHHYYFNYNYGTLYILDKLFNTYKSV